MRLVHYIVIAALLTIWSSTALATPTLSGPGGVITIPSAYVKSGGMFAPVTSASGNSESVTNFNYSMSDSIEVGLRQPSGGGTGVNLKYQLSADRKGSAAPPATAIGFMDQREEYTKSFYGVMSKNLQQSGGAPFVLHLGIMSEGSMAGHVRPIAGFETLLTSQMRMIGEYNGTTRDVNSGFVYHFTQNMGSFIYLMDIDSDGLNSDLVSGVTFDITF